MTQPRTQREGAAVDDSAEGSPVFEWENLTGPTVFYLYCVVENAAPCMRLLNERSIDGVAPTMNVFPIEYDGLAAAVSNVPEAVFEPETINSIAQDVSGLAPIALRHEQVMQTMLANAPAVIPLSMGVVFRSRESVVNLLRDQSERFRSLLDRVRNRTEWGIKVFRDASMLSKAASSLSPELIRIDEEIAASAPGRAYLLRKQKERLLGREIDRFLNGRLDGIVSRLREAGVVVQEETLPKVENNSLPVVLKLACLVCNDSFERFESALSEVDHANAPLGLRVEMNGPWAPYSFVGRRDE